MNLSQVKGFKAIDVKQRESTTPFKGIKIRGKTK